jgi:hypothetical protein
MNSRNVPGKLLSAALFLRALVGCAAVDEPTQTAAAVADGARLQGNAVRMDDWVIGCSNLNACTAIAPVREYRAGLEQAHLRIMFTRNVAAPPRLLVLRDGALVEELSQASANKLMAALADTGDGDAIHLSAAMERYDVPRKGFADVLAAQQQWQDAPSSQFLPTETIAPLPAVPLDTFMVPPLLKRAAKRCPEAHMGEPLKAWRGIGGAILWRIGCGNEGLNSVSYWYVSGPQGAPPEPVEFDARPGAVDAYNSWFDADRGYLRMVHYFGGQFISRYEDCGIYRAYAWGEGGMKLAEQRFMPQCGTGIGPAGWITTYRATALNGVDSGP